MPPPPQSLCGVVVSAGRMMKAVKVRTVKQVYDSFLQKVPVPTHTPFGPMAHIHPQHYTSHQSHLVSDPNSSLRTGDVVRIAARPPLSKHIRHVVTDILAPWGLTASERPPISRLEDLDAQYKAKREARSARRIARTKEAKTERAGAIEKAPSLMDKRTGLVGHPQTVGGEESNIGLS
ncbi:MAG: hypothetical protein Q9169_000587 [Polycauliona sp. 2 TL-2023]